MYFFNALFCFGEWHSDGDPLSPLLFVIVMVVLSRIISSTVNEGLLLGFWVGSRNVVAFNISSFVCGRYFNLTSILGTKLSSLPMKYLSLLLGSLFKTEGIIDKIERCLAGWKMMYLYGQEVGVASRIKKLWWDFSRDGFGEKFKFHLVSWS